LTGLPVGAPSAAAGSGCSRAEQLSGGCPGVTPEVGDGDVTLVGNNIDPGKKGSDGSKGEKGVDPADNDTWTDLEDDENPNVGSGDDGSNSDGTDGTGDPDSTDPADVDPGCSQELLCIDEVLVDEVEDDDGGIPDRGVTIQDVANFRPRTGTDAMEPEGWSIVRLNANFYSNAEQNVQVGELFGISAAVRFTPYAWRWDYGDGESLDSDDPGASWESLGLEEFSETATSHQFDDEGDFTIRLTVDFHAEYRFRGGEWTAIAGSVSRTADPVTATIGTAQTVLVSGECTSKSDATGC
jgi:hypothetical protein